MPQVSGNPEELIRFASALAHYLDSLEVETNNLKNSFGILGDTWQDEKRAAFEEQFNMLMGQIEQFKSSCDEQIPYLQSLAEKLQEYLGS